jgi:hypothetical protein
MAITHQTVMGEDGKPSAVLIPWDQVKLIREELEDISTHPGIRNMKGSRSDWYRLRVGVYRSVPRPWKDLV